MPVGTVAIGVIVTIVLTLITHSQYDRNERRLLHLRVDDAASLIVAGIPATQTPLAAAATLADANRGNVAKFKSFVADDVGAPSSGSSPSRFAGMSLWRVGDLARGPVATVGDAPKLATMPAATRQAFLTRAAHRQMVSLVGLLAGASPRLGYAFGTGDYVVYGEKLIPVDRRSRLQATSAFAGLNYALYLGGGERPKELIVTNLRHPPPSGLVAAAVVPYGNDQLTLVMGAGGSLAGWVPQALPWIIAVIGGLLTLAAAIGAARVTRRRRDAEQLAGTFRLRAGESRRLYAQQRSIAKTLQHALLPDVLPQLPGLQSSARYDAGERGIDIGGDWYDLIDQGDGRVLMVVGDVSGRGLRAGTTMAALRYAIHAYAAQKDAPAVILARLCRLVSLLDSGQFATVLLAQLDLQARTITLASAGHLPPLMISADATDLVRGEVGLPIGVDPNARYGTTTVAAPGEITLIAYTDGLIERRGESLDSGFARLRALAEGSHAALPELLETLVRELPGGRSADDIAILGVRWTTN